MALPTWPDVMDKWGAGSASAHPNVRPVDVLPEDYVHSPLDPSIVVRDDVTELTCDIGDLRPSRSIPTGPVTVVVWSFDRSAEMPDEISVELIGGATNRRGDKRFGTSLAVAPQTWSLDQLVKRDAQ